MQKSLKWLQGVCMLPLGVYLQTIWTHLIMFKFLEDLAHNLSKNIHAADNSLVFWPLHL